MANIFKDGTIVDNIFMPPEIWHGSAAQRKEWAVKELTAYIKTKHGGRFSEIASESCSHNGRVTGTQGILMFGGKEIVYMLVEPNGSRGEIHIVKSELSLSGASILDVIEYEEVQRKKVAGFKNSPFEKLASLSLRI